MVKFRCWYMGWGYVETHRSPSTDTPCDVLCQHLEPQSINCGGGRRKLEALALRNRRGLSHMRILKACCSSPAGYMAGRHVGMSLGSVRSCDGESKAIKQSERARPSGFASAWSRSGPPSTYPASTRLASSTDRTTSAIAFRFFMAVRNCA